MRYEIKGENLPVVICNLEQNEQMITERGGMAWMSPNMRMETTIDIRIGPGDRKKVFRGFYFPEYLHGGGRETG